MKALVIATAILANFFFGNVTHARSQDTVISTEDLSSFTKLQRLDSHSSIYERWIVSWIGVENSVIDNQLVKMAADITFHEKNIGSDYMLNVLRGLDLECLATACARIMTHLPKDQGKALFLASNQKFQALKKELVRELKAQMSANPNSAYLKSYLQDQEIKNQIYSAKIKSMNGRLSAVANPTNGKKVGDMIGKIFAGLFAASIALAVILLVGLVLTSASFATGVIAIITIPALALAGLNASYEIYKSSDRASIIKELSISKELSTQQIEIIEELERLESMHGSLGIMP